MAQFHFVEDYEAYVKQLIETKPLDEAMSLAIGGSYKLIGKIECRVLEYAGLKENMTLIDYGCGSGRLANALGQAMRIEYLGIDVVEDLLAYARTKSPDHYRYIKHHGLNVPAESDSVDMICAFSLFTHLLQAETYIYLEDMRRVLKLGGRLVFSFLELESDAQWAIFESTVIHQKQNTLPVLNTFMERNQIAKWADHLGFGIVEFIDGTDQRFDGMALGQSIAILEK